MNNEKRKPLPRMPHGEGSMSYRANGTIIYKKSVLVSGVQKRLCVYGKTPKECMREMKRAEEDAKATNIPNSSKLLKDDLRDWLVTYKSHSIKPTSYDRLERSYTHGVRDFTLGSIRVSEITSNDIQSHLNALVDDGKYSYSSIKKVHDLLNGYFRHKFEARELLQNPMTLVKMPAKDQVKPEKKLQYLTRTEITAFEKECLTINKTVNTFKHRFGPAFVFVIYTGLRVGELLALKFEDIDYEKRLMRINKTVEKIINRDYNENNREEMKRRGVPRYLYKTGSTKTKSSRVVALNSKAMEMLDLMIKYNKEKGEGSFVVQGIHGQQVKAKNFYWRLQQALDDINWTKGKCGPHMLRHTCASLLFDSGLRVEDIASILGNSPEICRRTYIHFIQEEKAQEIHKIAEFNI